MTSPKHQNRKRAVAPMPMPPTTSDVIIFPYNRQTNNFVTTFYYPQMTQNRIRTPDIILFLDELSDLASKYYKEFGFLTDGSMKLTCIFILCVIFFPMLFVYYYWMSKIKKRDDKARIEFIKKANVIARSKRKAFAQRGAKWVVPPDFPRWIELHTGAVPLTPLSPSPLLTPSNSFFGGRGSTLSESMLNLSPEKLARSPSRSPTRSPTKSPTKSSGKAKTEYNFDIIKERTSSLAEMEEQKEQGYHMRAKNKSKTHVSKTYTYNV